MEWGFEIIDGVSEPIKSMDKAFESIEADLKAVDAAMSRLEGRDALSKMREQMGKAGVSALQAPDVAAFTVGAGPTKEEAAAVAKLARSADEQREKEANLAAVQANRALGVQQLNAVTETYSKDLDALTKDLEKLERTERIEQALAMKDPTQRQISLMRIHQSDLRKLQIEERKAAEEAKKLASSVETIKWMEIGKVAYGAAKEVYGLAKSFVELAISEGGQRRGGIRTFDVMLGNKKAAEEEWELLEKMSDHTRYTTEQMMADYKSLFSFTQAYGTKATRDVMAAAGDIAVILTESAKDTFLSTIKQIQGREKLDSRTMMMLERSGLLSKTELETALAKRLDMDIGKPGTSDKIKKMLEHGKVRDDHAINAILDAVQVKYSRGKDVGSTSAEAATGSVGTQIKNLERLWGNMFDKLDTKPFANAIAQLQKLLDPESISGKRIAADIQKAFDIIVAVLQFAIQNFWILEGAVSLTLSAIDHFGKWLKEAGEAMGDWVWNMVDGFFKLWDIIFSFGSKVFDSVSGFGKAIVDGIWYGLTSSWRWLVERFESLVSLLPAAVKKVLGIASPSRVMEGLGVNTALGFTVGFEKVDPPDMSNLLDMRLPAPRFGTDVMLPSPKYMGASDVVARSGGEETSERRTVRFDHVEIPITINAGSATAAQQWSEMEPHVRAEIARFVETLAEEN